MYGTKKAPRLARDFVFVTKVQPKIIPSKYFIYELLTVVFFSPYFWCNFVYLFFEKQLTISAPENQNSYLILSTRISIKTDNISLSVNNLNTFYYQFVYLNYIVYICTIHLIIVAKLKIVRVENK